MYWASSAPTPPPTVAGLIPRLSYNVMLSEGYKYYLLPQDGWPFLYLRCLKNQSSLTEDFGFCSNNFIQCNYFWIETNTIFLYWAVLWSSFVTSLSFFGNRCTFKKNFLSLLLVLEFLYTNSILIAERFVIWTKGGGEWKGNRSSIILLFIIFCFNSKINHSTSNKEEALRMSLEPPFSCCVYLLVVLWDFHATHFDHVRSLNLFLYSTLPCPPQIKPSRPMWAIVSIWRLRKIQSFLKGAQIQWGF